MSDIATALAAPFPPEKVSWRVGSTNKRKRQQETKDQYAKATRGQALAYIDARDVMERFDEVCGPANWQCRYPHAGTKTVCEIGVKLDDEWIWKSNGAGDTDIEGDKGAMSDAFKRAAVLWGVGRYLYDVDAPWVALDDWEKIDHSEVQKLMRLLQPGELATGSPPAGVGEKSAYAARKEGKWDEVVNMFRQATTPEMLQEAASIHKTTIANWPGQWKTELRAIYDEHMDGLKARQAA